MSFKYTHSSSELPLTIWIPTELSLDQNLTCKSYFYPSPSERETLVTVDVRMSLPPPGGEALADGTQTAQVLLARLVAFCNA